MALHPDLTPWAGSSPRGRRAPLRTLKRLVRLRAATSASPKRHRGFLCRRGRKTTKKKIGPGSFIHVFIGRTAWLWSAGLRPSQTGIFIRHAERLGVCVQVIPSPAQGIMLPLFSCLGHSRACRAARPGPSPCPGAAPLLPHTPRPRQLPP